MKRFLYRLLLIVNILFAGALLISYLAVHVSPDKFSLPAFFGLAYPYLLFINIILALIWAVRLRLEVLISVVVIAIGYSHLSNYFRINKHNTKDKGEFTVISYNLRLFNSFESAGGSSEAKLLSYLKERVADVICLQEIYINGSPSKKEADFRKQLGGKYYSHMKVIGSGKNRYYGIATFSKYPIIKKGEIIHPGSSSLSIYTDIVIKSDTFRVFNNHLQSFRLQRMEKSFIEEITSDVGNETMNDVKRLSSRLKAGFVKRSVQAQKVKELINKSVHPVIVAGDFNDTPVSYTYRKIRHGLRDSFVEAGYGAGFTYRGNYPSNRIDYILFDDRLACKKFEILKVRFSDHYPVSAEFTVVH